MSCPVLKCTFSATFKAKAVQQWQATAFQNQGIPHHVLSAWFAHSASLSSYYMNTTTALLLLAQTWESVKLSPQVPPWEQDYTKWGHHSAWEVSVLWRRLYRQHSAAICCLCAKGACSEAPPREGRVRPREDKDRLLMCLMEERLDKCLWVNIVMQPTSLLLYYYTY